MSALRVSTDNLITQGPLHLLYVRRHAPPHSPLQFIASVRPSPSSSSPPPLTVSSVSNFHPFVSICTFIGHTFPFFSSSLPPLFPLHPSPTHCYTSIFLLRFLLFHPSIPSVYSLSLSVIPPSHQCSGYTIAVVAVGGGGGWGGPASLPDLMSSCGDRTEAIKRCVLLYSRLS